MAHDVFFSAGLIKRFLFGWLVVVVVVHTAKYICDYPVLDGIFNKAFFLVLTGIGAKWA